MFFYEVDAMFFGVDPLMMTISQCIQMLATLKKAYLLFVQLPFPVTVH